MSEEIVSSKSMLSSLKKKKLLWKRQKTKAYEWDFHDEEGREQIHEWSKSRVRKHRGINKTYHGFLVYTFNLNTLNSFIQNFNFMVIIQMLLAGVSIYIFQHFEIHYDVSVSLFVSPIVFPLAFSINTDFQRREKVLEDLANFKSSGMLWYFCMREWKEAAGLDAEWINIVHTKLKSMLFHLREFLLTERLDRRKDILCAMYEDISDASQLIERIRSSKLPTNTAIVSRLIHLLQMMSLSFERLRVIREYRSPRSIRAFNKVLILLLPIILGPYFVYQALDKHGKVIPSWTPYYISVLVSFVFSALQGVQDKLDDPFDGMSEDDIKLDQIDEWTFTNLGATVNRTFKIGRFQVNIDGTESIRQSRSQSIVSESLEQTDSAFERKRKSLKKRASSLLERPGSFKRSHSLRHDSTFDPSLHPYADVLENISGNTRIEKKGGVVRPEIQSFLNLKPIDLGTESVSNRHKGRFSSVRELKKPLSDLFKEPDESVKTKARSVSFDETPTIFLSRVTTDHHAHTMTPPLTSPNLLESTTLNHIIVTVEESPNEQVELDNNDPSKFLVISSKQPNDGEVGEHVFI